MPFPRITVMDAGQEKSSVDNRWNGVREFTPPPHPRPKLSPNERCVLEGVGTDAPTVIDDKGAKQFDTPSRIDLVPMWSLFEVGKVVKKGEAKYGFENWKLIDWRSHLNHALVHAVALLAGDTTDDHFAHLVCRAMMAHNQWLDEQARQKSEASLGCQTKP